MNVHPLIPYLTATGPASAHDIARDTNRPLGAVLVDLQSLWWEVLQLAGPAGWLYTIRPVVNARKRLPKEVGHYHDDGCTKNGPRGFIK
jgi:hypothetical protein